MAKAPFMGLFLLPFQVYGFKNQNQPKKRLTMAIKLTTEIGFDI